MNSSGQPQSGGRNILVNSTCSANISTDYWASSLKEIQSSTVQAAYHIEALQSTNKDRNGRYCHNYSDEISICTLCSCNWRPQLPRTPIWRTLPRPTTLLTQKNGKLMTAPKIPRPLSDRDISYLRDNRNPHVEPMSGVTILLGFMTLVVLSKTVLLIHVETSCLLPKESRWYKRKRTTRRRPHGHLDLRTAALRLLRSVINYGTRPDRNCVAILTILLASALIPSPLGVHLLIYRVKSVLHLTIVLLATCVMTQINSIQAHCLNKQIPRPQWIKRTLKRRKQTSLTFRYARRLCQHILMIKIPACITSRWEYLTNTGLRGGGLNSKSSIDSTPRGGGAWINGTLRSTPQWQFETIPQDIHHEKQESLFCQCHTLSALFRRRIVTGQAMLQFARTQFPLTDSGPLQGYPEFGNRGNFTDTIINDWLEKHSHPPVKLLSLQGRDHLAQEHTPLHMLHKGTNKDQILGRLPPGCTAFKLNSYVGCNNNSYSHATAVIQSEITQEWYLVDSMNPQAKALSDAKQWNELCGDIQILVYTDPIHNQTWADAKFLTLHVNSRTPHPDTPIANLPAPHTTNCEPQEIRDRTHTPDDLHTCRGNVQPSLYRLCQRHTYTLPSKNLQA
jgi:hypothetical protein